MSAVLRIADAFRDVIVPFLAVACVALAAMLGGLLLQRARRVLRERREARIQRLWRPEVDARLHAEAAGSPPPLRCPRRHRHAIGRLIVSSVRHLTGRPVATACGMAASLGLLEEWRHDLEDARWWRRAWATRALGVVADAGAFDRLVAALDDPHEEVRAAAVEALGRIGDVRAVGPLLSRLPEQSRHQRVRIVEAVHALGVGGADEVLACLRGRPDLLPLAAELAASVCGAAAVDDLLRWAADPRAEVRAAALQVLGAVGLDDRTYYHALRGLADDDPAVRAMAACALGRSRRSDAASYLAERLDDEWCVAAQSARGLGQLAAPGRAALAARASAEGPAGDLARHTLWLLDARREARGGRPEAAAAS